MNKKYALAIILFVSLNSVLSQSTTVGNTQNFGQTNFIGYTNNFPLYIRTNDILRAEFTTNATMVNTLIPGVGAGDGLRIMPKTLGCGGGSYPSVPTASVDIWTSCSNGTNIRWDGSGQISGLNNRFEQWANYNGFYFNTFGSSGLYKFARNGVVTALVGTNNYWRIGQQNDNSNFNGFRRLEVLDNTHQFRLTYANPNSPTGPYTDFFTNANGNLQIQPSGQRVGINLGINPTANLDVNGDVRIRNVQTATPNSILIGVNADGPNDVNVRRLDFTGNANQVLLGNGTWGTAPNNVTANQGVSRWENGPVQLGDVYFWLTTTNTPLTVNRQIRLGGQDLIFSGEGRVAIGLSYPELPTEVLDVNGNARFRNVPAQGGQSLILGFQNGSANDVELSRLAFPNDNNQVLLGDGTWGSPPVSSFVVTANNGLTINPANNVQWGQFNTGLGTLNGGQLIQSTEIPMNGNNLSFYGMGVPGWNRIFFGSQVTLGLSTKMALNNDTEKFGFLVIHSGVSQGEVNNNTNPAGIRVMTLGFNSSNPAFSNVVSGVHAMSSNLNSMNSTGLYGIAIQSMRERVGVEGIAVFECGATPCTNYGSRFSAGNGNMNFGVYSSVVGTGNINYAAYFVGDSYTSAGAWSPSDSTLKQNILSEDNILSQVARLRPVNYSMRQDEFPYLGLSGYLQHGFISQEVQEIFPELVQTIVQPAQYDSLGVEISPETEILGLNYNGFISLNTQAIIELNRKVENQTLSDESLKIEVVDLENSLDKILNLRGVTYQWSPGAIDSLKLDYATHIGFIAQEVQDVDPLLTYLDDMDLLHVDYAKVVPVLVEAVQEMNDVIVGQEAIIAELNNTVSEQITQINDLNDRLTLIENCLSGILPLLCQMNNTMIQPTQEEVQNQMRAYIDVELNNSRAIVLDQNVPNPFAETTVITFSIPESVSRAQIHFYDASGNLIKSVEVTERGDGQLNVFGQDLSSGLYTYTLVADGQLIATKKMVKQ